MKQRDSNRARFKDIQPKECNAALVLEDGTIFWGQGAGIPDQDLSRTAGEVCFNTSLTGYQEVLTDPSYAGQIVTFTYPHIGNVGTNEEDNEAISSKSKGCVLATEITNPANWRAGKHLNAWLRDQKLAAVTGIDTRSLTKKIRDNGAITGVIVYAQRTPIRIRDAIEVARNLPKLEGKDLVTEVTCKQSYHWNETTWAREKGYGSLVGKKYLVVAIDYGAKRNMLRCLAHNGCDVLVVPATTSAEQILAYNPNGIFLSNGPGDPKATGKYAIPNIKKLIESKLPIFGICLGHQMLALALGAETNKMHHGHRGANHPVKRVETGTVEITSQNHGFVVETNNLPTNLEVTHTSLFDGTLEGICVKDNPIFSVQYHPESSPGPHDSHYLFDKFIKLMKSGRISA